MSAGNAIAVMSEQDDGLRMLPSRPAVSLPTPDEVKSLQAYGEMIAASKLFPNATSWQGAVMIARYGQQLGVDEFTALTQIYWIKGTPTCSAQLMNALITRDHGGDAIHPVESTPKVCTISYKRKEWAERREATYRIEDVPSGLKTSSDAWKNYPGDMLFARLISRIARQSFPDVIRGLYTRDEIEDSQAIETRATVVTPTRPALVTRDTPPSSLSPGRDRNLEARGLINAIIDTYGVDPEGAKQTGEDLICLRFGFDQTADATAEQLHEVRTAVESWQHGDPSGMLAHLRMVASAETATMARDVETVLGEQNVNDPFVLGALIERLDALELEEQRTEIRNHMIDALMTPS